MLDLKVKGESCDVLQLVLTDIIGFRVGELVVISIVGLLVTGSRLGFSVGDWVVIKTVGAGVTRVGAPVGTGVDRIGALVGTGEGFFVVGIFVGFFVGLLEGRAVGLREGGRVGGLVGRRVGNRVGLLVCNEGTIDGLQPTEPCPGVGLRENWAESFPRTLAAPTVGLGVNTTT